MDEKKTDGMSRRNFLKTGVFAAASIMTAGLVTGCGNGRKSNLRKDKEGGSLQGEEPAFMKAPAPIDDSSIKETKEADVIVVGAGMSGLCAAVSAAESGAKVMVLKKARPLTSAALTMVLSIPRHSFLSAINSIRSQLRVRLCAGAAIRQISVLLSSLRRRVAWSMTGSWSMPKSWAAK